MPDEEPQMPYIMLWSDGANHKHPLGFPRSMPCSFPWRWFPLLILPAGIPIYAGQMAIIDP
jgi:hypothetical protein